MHDKSMVRVVALVRELRDLPAARWEPLLRERLPAEAAIRRTVLRLLHERTPLDDAVLRELQHAVAAACERTDIGPYRVLRLLGEGGMGIVYLAEQTAPVHRLAAVKVMAASASGQSGLQHLARFERERQALAALEHENIAKLYDAGTTPAAEPWFAMEFVDGEPLTEFSLHHRLGVRQRVHLFLQVCGGVHHAHQKGLIHRDLKPANVLVTWRDPAEPVSSAVAKVIDFGIARDIAAVERGGDTTQVGQLVGTPTHMAPEQARCDPALIDTRTDVYALGVMLYELMSGAPPPSSERLRSAHLAEVAAMFDEPDPLPSTRCEPAQRGALRGDLDWIVMRAMEREPGRRYSGCDTLAADLRRYLRHEPVEAVPPTIVYRCRKFWERNRLLAIASSMTLTALLLGGGLSLAGMVAEARERRSATAWLQRFQLLRGQIDMQRLGQEAERLFPLPTHEDALRQWLDRARLLRPMQANVDRTRESLAASTEDPAMQLAPDDLAFLHQSLQALAEQFAAFFGRSGLVAEVEKRLVRATTLVRRSVEAPAAEWANAIAMVAGSPRYGGLKLSPQVGLVPIGHDPDSGFAEFAVLDTGELPARRDGRLIVTLRSAIVLVLLPGGVARIGAVNSPGDPRHDPDASSQEGPVHEVRLDPFFIGKCELTQGQWLAMTGKNPSYYSRSLNFGVTDRHPATNLAQDVCDQNLCRFDLTLPTEVQWEYACRAGTDTPWWTGADREGLRENGIAANLADQTAKRRGATWPPIAEWPDYDDRHVIQAPVGLLLPNPFGLHDVHGNVWEWCLDDGGRYGLDEPRPGDGYRQSRATDLRQSRGGAFSYGAQAARSSSRNAVAKNSAGDMDGARVARSLRAP